MVLIVIIMVIASRPRAGIRFCPLSPPWPVMGGPTRSPSARSCCVVRRSPLTSLCLCCHHPRGEQRHLSPGALQNPSRALVVQKVFEKGTLYQNSHWLPTDLGIKSTLQFGLWPWWPVPCLSLWPLLETLSPLSPCLGHTAFEKAP